MTSLFALNKGCVFAESFKAVFYFFQSIVNCYDYFVTGETKKERDKSLKSNEDTLCTKEKSALPEGIKCQNCVIFSLYQ